MGADEYSHGMSDPLPTDSVIDLVAFLNAAPTPYHAAAEVARRLERAGYRALDERAPWQLASGDKGYVLRGGGSIFAFQLGTDPPARAGFRIIGAHTDSPNFRVKPSAPAPKKGHVQVAVAPYGGVLMHTWLDRDLSVAGRLSLMDGTTHLVNVRTPICRMSSLAIHLDPKLVTDGLQLNAQTHLVPTLGLAATSSVELSEMLAESISGASGVRGKDIAAFDLCLYDVQPATLGGAARELIYAARLDNLASCHAAVTALLASTADEPATRAIVLYDHEEVGSQSSIGARSRFLSAMLERLARAVEDGSGDALDRALGHSSLLSVDMAHAVHPCFPDRHDVDHMPRLAEGPVVKVNVNQAYATDGPSAGMVRRLARDAEIPIQTFVSRNDYRCGSTIGPIAAAETGMRTVDLGNPMLSMHSCREVAASADVPSMIALLERFLACRTLPPPSA
jgi:aspartyl aminopeptidase